jgi:sugar lactone lactonase YvrE
MGTLTRVCVSIGVTVAALALAGPVNARPFPEVVSLPAGWAAEGVATGTGSTVYAGSLATGAVWKGDLRTGVGGVLVPPQDGRVAVGLKQSGGLLFVAGGPTGQAYVYDATTGTEVVNYQLAAPGSFINDVTVTRDDAWFTDSFNAVLYRIPLNSGVPAGEPIAVPLTGDWEQVPGLFVFNANGIASSPSGDALLVVNSTTGTLYRVDPVNGAATVVQTSAVLTSGDGILLRGRELAVVRNQLNEIAILRMSPDLLSATPVKTLKDPDFAVPTTVAAFGSTLYAVNARFGQTSPDPLPYEIVKVDGS